jgi:hypothetical protein
MFVSGDVKKKMTAPTIGVGGGKIDEKTQKQTQSTIRETPESEKSNSYLSQKPLCLAFLVYSVAPAQKFNLSLFFFMVLYFANDG